MKLKSSSEIVKEEIIEHKRKDYWTHNANTENQSHIEMKRDNWIKNQK